MSEGDPKKRAKVKRAAEHPDRPGEECKAEPGVYEPAVDRGRCEGKGDCVDVCPVDCIHPRKDEGDFEAEKMLFIHPDECIDCGACVPACPVEAIFALDEVPEKWKNYIEINAKHFQK